MLQSGLSMKDYGTFAVFHEDVFVEHYRPYVPRAIPRAEIYGDFELQPSREVYAVLRGVDRLRVWTIIEDGNDCSRNLYYSPGFHVVNRVGYAVTHKPHCDAQVEFCAYWRRSLSQRGLAREINKLHAYLRRREPNQSVPTFAASN
jgi:hypothetical protein